MDEDSERNQVLAASSPAQTEATDVSENNELDELPSQPLTCPHCGGAVDVSLGEVARRVICPACEAEFVVPAKDGSTEVPDAEIEADDEEPLRRREEELSGRRIRQVAVAKRAAIKTRSYLIVALWACVVITIQLTILTAERIQEDGFGLRPGLYLTFAAVCGLGAIYFYRKAREVRREIESNQLAGPEIEPDFSTLSDGSQRVTNLERMTQSDPPKP